MKPFSWHGFAAQVSRANPLARLAILTLLACASAPRSPRRDSPSDSGLAPTTLVSADGLRVTTQASWSDGLGRLRPDLEVAWESPTEVALRTRRNTRPIPPGFVSAPAIQYGPVSVSLPSPLGTRRLVDADTGRQIRYLDGKRLADITWLPPGYRFEGDSLPLLQLPEDPEAFGWSRTYVENDPSLEARPELVVTQVSGPVPGGWGSTSPIAAEARVGEHPAVIREYAEPDSTRIRERAVCWSTAAFSYCITSRVPANSDNDVLSRDTLLRIAQRMRIRSIE